MFRNKALLALPLALLSLGLATPARATVITGTIIDWPESGDPIEIGDGTHHVSLWWSINTYDRGWFYGSSYDPFDSDVALATGVTDITQITDASVFAFTSTYVGPLCDADCDPDGVGEFVVWRHVTTGHYGVLRIDDIRTPGSDIFASVLDGTWWFQSDGSGDFSGSAVPEPATSMLLLVATATLLARRRRR